MITATSPGRYQGYIQPIIVRKSGTHQEMVEAAARASVQAWLKTASNPVWQPWLNNSFGKTVRRGRDIEIEKCKESIISTVKVGDAEAFACLPFSTDQLPDPIKKLQVSGTDRPRDTWDTTKPDKQGPVIIINLGAHMTTGKTCAQVAHAVFGWALKQKPETLIEWFNNNTPIYCTETTSDLFDDIQKNTSNKELIIIRDAGHTEVSPNTATVMTTKTTIIS